jgi:hypothetical protein
MNSSSEPTLTVLRIARAYGQLSSIPDDRSKVPVSVARIGHYEIRMFRSPDTQSGALFWLELFDHSTRTSIESFQCHEIRDATPAFEDLMSQADYWNSSEPGAVEAQ